MGVALYGLAEGLCVGAAAGAAIGWLACVPVGIASVLIGLVAERASD